MTSSKYFYSGVFMVSLCLMGLQILQSRIFSVTTWYHLAFLVISIAMFGMTLAALNIHRGDAAKQRENHAEILARAADGFGLYILVALLAQLFIPIIYTNFWGSAFTLPLLSFFTVLPYYKAGVVLTLALTRTPYPVGRTYGVDLIGAAAGCMFALLLMKCLDAPSAVLFLSVLAFAASLCFSKMGGNFKSGNAVFLMVVAVGAIGLNVLLPKPFIYPVWIKSRIIMQDALVHDEWNAISRVTVNNEDKDAPPFLWGPSPLLPEGTKTSYYYLAIDGDAGTPINKFGGNRGEIAFLEYDVTTIAYALPGIERVGIIGVGGGRDALTAHYFGAKEITAMDVNNVQIELLTQTEPFKSYAGLSNLPGLRLIHSEARSWFSRNREQFDLIQMSLIDTWAATGAGAFALSENGLYTTDALAVFLADLDEDGILTVSRWYTDEATNETERLLALAAAALFNNGAQNPRAHLFIARSGQIATLVLSKSPFTAEQLGALQMQAEKRGFDILVAPDRQSAHGMFNQILAAKNVNDLRKLAADNPLDISPPDDNRPFFFNQVRLGNPLQVIAMINSNSNKGILGHARATLNLYLILGFALFMVVFAILRPLFGATAGADKKYIAAGTSWFLLIGLGFMLLEVALLQRMSIFLGHPVYGLSVVLFSLVLSTGLGALLSEKIVLTDSRKRMIWIALTAGLAIALSFLIAPVFAVFAEASLALQAAVCVALAAPLGLLLGFGFPTGMTLVKTIDEKPSAWFWGINGAAGVMGSALAVALNIALGLHCTIILGGLCYALLLLPSAGFAALKRGQA